MATVVSGAASDRLIARPTRDRQTLFAFLSQDRLYAAYAIADTTSRTVELHRLAYDMRRAQAKIVAVGLPDVLARRLAAGR